MKQIEFERWEPDAENPCKLKYAGQRTAEDVFHELEARLDSIGYLPDEYLLLDNRWQNGREMPRDAGFFCRTDYGGSEGIYLDVFLEWYEDSQRRTEHFMTGKTLGESDADMDRMSLISSAITKAIRGDNSVHARYIVVGGQSGPEETMSLNAGFLHTLDAGAYLPRTLKQMLDGTLGVFAERIGRQLFKLAVEQNVNNHILASDTDIDAARYMKMHALSMDQVRGTNGKISFVDVLQQEKAL